ncbi:HET-domain-containing protein [Hypoxylon crocopeplum]|nr:HET-domain-containing protein [Hypoxylon crocopeplum]
MWLQTPLKIVVATHRRRANSGDPPMREMLSPKLRNNPPYRALDPVKREIRLLDVLPGVSSTTLQANLVYTSLADPTPYETISYCWGDASARATIMLDGSAFDVPASSLATLKCMRKQHESRRVWIDAICINQEDLHERGSQVALMSQIYEYAQLNLIYLGDEDEMARRAIACITDLLQEINVKTNRLSEFHHMMREYKWGVNRALNQSIECDLDESALFSFFDRPWFRRLWVVQEAALAPVSMCFCGPNLVIKLVDLLRAAIWLCYNQNSIPRRLFDHDGLHNAADLWSLVDDRDAYNASENAYEVDLSALILLAQYRLSSEPKDKVFAIVGLLPAPSETTEGADASLLVTDYNKPFVRILCDATRYSVQELNSLRILQAIRSDVKPDGLDTFPSWVARVDRPFDEKRDAENIPFNCFQADNGVGVFAEYARSDFAGPETLALARHMVTQVDKASDPFTSEIWESREALAKLLVSILDIVRAGNQAELELWGDNEGIDHSFSPMLASTLIAGNIVGRIPDDDELRVFRSFFNALIAGAETNDPENKLYYRLESACRNRRFFIGINGFIGLVLYGGSVPFMLRNVVQDCDDDPHYNILGDAYVNGVMDGSWIRLGDDLSREAMLYRII